MTPRPKRVVILGGGLSGLCTAFACTEAAQRARQSLELTVLEASDRPGGAIGTDVIDGFRVERGADGFLTEKPSVVDLARRLGIAERLVSTRPQPQGAWVVHRGKLVPIPVGFSLLAPTRAWPMVTTPLLSWRGKSRLLLDLLLRRGRSTGDESLGSFVRRRLGQEVLDHLAQPLAGGIYGADPEKLSLRATMPRFLEAEARHRSVILGLRRQARRNRETARGARYSLFASFDGGMQVLVDALVNALPPGALLLGQKADRMEVQPTGMVVTGPLGRWEADVVVLAFSSPVAGSLLRTIAPELATKLAQIEHASAATVALAFPSSALPQPLTGYGYVVPTLEQRASTAATFASQKWPNRAPDGFELIRVFLGGPTSPSVEHAFTDDLVGTARRELRDVLGITTEPLFAVPHRYLRAMPQYHVGHVERAAAIDADLARYPHVRLAGNSLTGVGMPDVVRKAEAVAASIFSGGL